jgi:PAS domain S-box-containing protein
MTKSSRKTIGILNKPPSITNHQLQWQGCIDSAKENDLNLIYYPGEALNSPENFRYQANILYDLVSPKLLDGLIIFSGALTHFVSITEMKKFIDRFKSLPIVSVEIPFEGTPSILMDNYKAMKDMMRHLTKDHNYKRIAFIQGPESNLVSRERYQAYLDSLNEFGLTLDLNLVTKWSDFDLTSNSIHTLLDERGLKPVENFDAIVGVNDLGALKAIEVLQEQGFNVPKDVAVVGFDDYDISWSISPPLTTVRPPFYEMSRQAVDLLKRVLEKEQVEYLYTVPMEVVIRQSCGCTSRSELNANSNSSFLKELKVNALTKSDKEISVLKKAMIKEIETDFSSSKKMEEYLTLLLIEFDKDIGKKQQKSYLPKLKELLEESTINVNMFGFWNNVISLMRRHILPTLTYLDSKLAEDLWQKARIIIGDFKERNRAYQTFLTQDQTQLLREIGSSLIATFNIKELMEALVEGLVKLKIPKCYLSLYEDSKDPRKSAKQLLAYSEESQSITPSNSRRFRPYFLSRGAILDDHKQIALIVEPLYFRKNHLGFVVFEVNSIDGNIYQTLRTQVSSSLQGALLFAETKRQKYIFDTFMATVPDSIYFKDLKSRIITANVAQTKKLNLHDPDEAFGKTDFDFFPKDQAQKKLEQEEQIIRSGKPIVNYEEPEGSEKWALTTKMPLCDEVGKIVGTFGISRDITELKHAQQALAKAYEEVEERVVERTKELQNEVKERAKIAETLKVNERQYRILAEQMRDGVVILQNKKLLFANNAFLKMVGHPKSKISILNFFDLFSKSSEQTTRKYLNPEDGDFPETQWQIELITMDKGPLWIEIEQTTILWYGNPALLLTIRNIHQRKLLENRLKEEQFRLQEENVNLKSSIKDRFRFGDLIGKSQSMQHLYELIINAATSDVNVLVAGESGTGKELIARMIHKVSPRKKYAFVPVNCASIPDTLFEREFFGHRKGAFTGADRDHPGFFDQAHKGVLFLDEATELSPWVQAKLLRVLQDGEYMPLGSNKPKIADMLIVAATNKDCQIEIDQGHLRQDFYYRLCVIEISVPPLRKRKDDLPLLIEYILKQYRDKQTQLHGHELTNLPSNQTMLPNDLIEGIYSYDWPGNIRELQNVLQRYLATSELPSFFTNHSESISQPTDMEDIKLTEGLSLTQSVEIFEKKVIYETLTQNRFNIKKVAKKLNIPQRTLYRRIKRHRLMDDEE